MNKTKTTEDKAQVLKSNYLHKMGIRVERNDWFIAMLGVLCAYVVHIGAIGGKLRIPN